MGSTTNSRSSSGDPYVDPGVLGELGGRGCERVDELFYELGVSLRRSGHRYVGACPVHGGRSPHAISFYPEGDEVRGFWKCRTDHCDRHFPRSLVGFVRGVLSHREHGWEREGDPEVGHRAAVDWVCQFLRIDIGQIAVDPLYNERRAFRRSVRALNRDRPTTQETLCTREQLRRMLTIPSHYFLARGYSAGVLERFEVGEVSEARSPNFGRALIPVHDDDHDDPIGAITRSVHEKCPECRLCHDPAAPCPPPGREVDRLRHLRYGTVGRFLDKNHLYNIPGARGVAREYRCVVIVEGAADVWRLEEAGVRNAVALFGSELTVPQKQLLMELMPRQIVILTDDDESGHDAAKAIDRQCLFANTSRVLPAPGFNDVGSMPVDEVRRVIVPQIESRMRRP